MIGGTMIWAVTSRMAVALAAIAAANAGSRGLRCASLSDAGV